MPETESLQQDHIRRLERMYHNANTNALIPANLDIVDRGRAELKMPIDERYLQAGQAVHGMLYFKAMDEVAFYAAQSLVTDMMLLTESMNIHFTRPLFMGTMHADAQVIKTGRTVHIVEARVSDEQGRLSSFATATFMPGRLPLGDIDDYVADLA